MRIRLALALTSTVFLAAGCGEVLSTNGSNPANEPDGSSSIDGASPDASPGADAAEEAPFCERASSFAACEDFERGATPMRGWSSPVASTIATSDRVAGGSAARIAVSGEGGAPSPTFLAMPAATGETKVHLELVAKIDPGAMGDLTIAKVTVMDATSRKLEAFVTLRPGAETVVSVCHPGIDGGSTCTPHQFSESFASWTSVVVEVSTNGHYDVTIGGSAHSDDGFGIGAIGSVRAEVGAVVVWTGGGARVLWIDDALVSVK